MDKNDRLSNGPFYCLSSLEQECAEGVDRVIVDFKKEDYEDTSWWGEERGVV